MVEKEQELFDNNLLLLNQQISNTLQLEEKFQDFFQTRKNSFLVNFEPYTNKYLCELFNRGLIPSFASKRKKRLLLNIIRCETHRELLLKSLND